MAGLVREAIDRALADAGSTFDDIDAVVVGKAPDLFEGVMMPELFLADALGATGKPLIRVHTAGSVGGSTAIVAASLVQAGVHSRVLTMAWEKQSESNAMWALSIPVPFTMPVGAGAGGYFAPHVRSYIRRSGAPTHIGAMVAVKDRLNGSQEPARPPAPARHHAGVGAGVADAVGPDPLRRDLPVLRRRLRAGDRRRGNRGRRVVDGHPVAWIHATAMRTEPLAYSGRDQVNPQAGRDAAAALWKEAGITSPIDEIDVAEIYVPFSWFEPMWLENLGFAPEGEGWKLTEAGETAIGGRLPVNPSGGVLSSNPIGASGMIRFAEAAIQVMGKAGDHQVRERPQGARPRLRRRLAVLLDVGRLQRQAGGQGMKYTCSVAMSPVDQLVELARTAEEVGFDSIALPDSLFYMEKQSADYPYTPDGSRMWNPDTPWVDPLIAAAAMGAVTSTLRFYTNVMKLGSRNPLLLARQVGSVANLTNNRFGFGVGIGWAPEEFEWCGVPYAKRGARVDEMIDVIKLVLGGGMVEFHGEFFDFDKLQMSPAPIEAGAVLRRRPHRCGAAPGRPRRRRLDQRDDEGRTAGRDHRQAQRAAGRIRPRRRAVRVPGRVHRQVRRRRPPRTRRGRRHRQHRHPVGFRRARLRRPAGGEEGFAEALRRHLHPLRLAGLT